MVFKVILEKLDIMKRIVYLTIGVLAISMLFPACVSKRKYYAAQRANNELTKENRQLATQVSEQRSTLNALTDSVNNLKGNIAMLADVYQSTNSQLNMSKEQIAAQRARVKQLEDYLYQQQQATQDLKKKMADALVGFNANELTVTLKNGKVYVSMQESLLFPSGSAVVNTRGKDALAKVAGVLNTNPDISVDIEGHTDKVPIHNKKYNDNWDLSTARAVSIAHVLIDDYHVTPEHIIASGRSQYQPIASNDDAGGRALNRRTEIILEPKLDQLMQILNAPIPSAKN